MNSYAPDRLKRSINDTIMNTSKEDFANKFKRIRACARCHRLKMKCVFEDPSFESCTRCFKAGIECSVTEDPTSAYAKSRPRKRSKLKGIGPLGQLQDAINESSKLLHSVQRSEMLENDESINLENLSTLQLQLSEIQRLILHTISSQKKRDDSTNRDTSKSEMHLSEANSVNSMKEGIVKAIPSLPWISYNLNIMKEIIRLEILSTAEATRRTNYFFAELQSYWPCVSFPKHYTYDWLLENEPLVLLSFITVTCLNEPDLHDTLLYYLEDNLSVRTSITGNISFSFIQIYLVLSLWCSPPRKWGSYKHQMSLLMALNLTLCLDLGNEVYKNGTKMLKDDSPERHMIRSYLGVYSCCGSLGLSLPRFKVVNWTPVHERCSQILLLGESSDADKFLYFYSKLVALGEEIFQFLCPNGFPNVSVNRKKSDNFETPSVNGIDLNINNLSLRSIMVSYEKRMQQLAVESSLFKTNSKVRNSLSIIYYQLLMTMYDYIVCRVLLRRDILTEVYLQTLNRLIKASEKVIDSFVGLCDQTSDFPTFFYYRPMHALVALIRARLLVKTQQLDFEVNVEQEHDKVLCAIKKVGEQSKVAYKMGAILTRISKWMKVSSKFNKNGATNSMVDLLNELGNEKAIEKIKINLNSSESNHGDDLNLSKESTIQFNKIINYGTDNIKNGKCLPNLITSTNPNLRPIKMNRLGIHERKYGDISTTSPNGNEVDATLMKEGISLDDETIDPNVEDNRSNSIFIPSPIGYSNSEIMEPVMTVPSTNSVSLPLTNILNREEGDNSQINTPGIKTFSNGALTNDTVKSKSLSINDPFLNNNLRNLSVSLDTLTQNNASSPNDTTAQIQLQQQEFLNDLFTQIDTDIMNLEDSNNLTNGFGMPPMFDFLGGNLGFPTGLLNKNMKDDLTVPEDWYKGL